jgi:hypothetical protein
MVFDPYNCPLKIQESIGTITPKMGIHLGVSRVHSLTLFCTLESMRCDSWASLLAHNLTSPCLGYEPKARVATTFGQGLYEMITNLLGTHPIFNPPHMQDLMDDVDGNYNSYGLTPNIAINLNENSIDANYEAMQNVNVKKDTNVDDG